MTSAAKMPEPTSGPLSSDPRALRASLSPALAAEFDSEWKVVVEQVKQSMDINALFELLNKWQHTVYAETQEPGSYGRMLTKAEEILRSGGNPDAVPFEEMRSLIRARRNWH